MIPLHITTTEWYGIVAIVVTMLAIVAYMAYRAGALDSPTLETEEQKDG
jgi:hypothetical protein